MAEKYLKIIQNGNVSFVPDAYAKGVYVTRRFWDSQNRLYAKSREAEKHIVTYTAAKDEEVAHLFQQPTSVAAPANNEMQSLREQIAAQQVQIELLIKIASGKQSVEEIKEPEKETKQPEEGGKERQKPGPKPKQDGKAD